MPWKLRLPLLRLTSPRQGFRAIFWNFAEFACELLRVVISRLTSSYGETPAGRYCVRPSPASGRVACLPSATYERLWSLTRGESLPLRTRVGQPDRRAPQKKPLQHAFACHALESIATPLSPVIDELQFAKVALER